MINENLNETKIDSFKDVEKVYHFAASPEVKLSSENPRHNFDNNVISTFNVLENCRLNDINKIIFASSSTVYGKAATPTKESQSFDAISNYGATKIAAESMIKSYSESYGINYTILRYANIFGPRSKHGVIHDFFYKLKKNPTKLEILGDGEQNKSYLYIDDCVDATLLTSKIKNSIFNIGSEDQTKVKDIAKIVVEEIGLENVEFFYTGKSWIGDVTEMLLDVTKIKKLGWKPKISLREGIKRYISWLKYE